MTASVGFLKGPWHLSFSSVPKLFRDVLKVRVSRGLLAKVVRKVSTRPISLARSSTTCCAMANNKQFVDVGAEYYERQYRERVVKNLARRAAQLDLALVPAANTQAKAADAG